MAAIQLSFSLRTTANVKQVHLIGSWDGYQGQLPLSRESGSSKWRGTFRFQSNLMQPGSRYWFYYMLDGYQVCHDPSKEYTQEPTTGRNLNILDVPANAAKSSKRSGERGSRRYSREIPRGRPTSTIASPKPVRPGHVAKKLERQALAQLTERLATTRLADYSSDSEIDDTSEEDSSGDDDSDSDVPSLSSGGSTLSGCSSPSSISSTSSSCTCERYGITRSGERVKLDCGGSRCGSDVSTENSSESEEDSREYRHHVREPSRSHKHKNKHKHSSSSSKRHGVVIR
jgi:hypothetical protein